MTTPIALTHLSLIRIHGTDAAQFLQGQLTNDVNSASGQWQFTGYCNPKGRLLGLFQLWRTDQQFFLLMETSLTATLLQRLKMYVLRSDVNIESVPTATLTGHFLENAKSEGQPATHTVETMSASAYRLWYAGRYLNIDITSEPASAASNARLQTWLAADIADGIPRVTDATTEQFVPQMINLDALDGINFKKGCYTGQEIVARMHYLGKLKQRMFLCALNNVSDTVGPGDKIVTLTEGSEPGAQVGTIVSAIPGSDQLLVVLRLEELDAQLALVDGSTISVLADQPYALPAPRKSS